MNFRSYFYFLDKYIKIEDDVNGKIYYNFNNAFEILYGIGTMFDSYDNIQKLKRAIETNYCFDGVMYVKDSMYISENIMYYMTLKSPKAVAMVVLLWISNKTLNNFKFRQPNMNPIIFHGRGAISTVYANGTFYFDFHELCTALEIRNPRHSMDTLDKTEEKIYDMISDSDRTEKRIYKNMKDTKNFVTSLNKYINVIDLENIFRPIENEPLDDIGIELLRTQNIIYSDMNRKHRYINLPMLYRFLCRYPKVQHFICSDWMVHYWVPVFKKCY